VSARGGEDFAFREDADVVGEAGVAEEAGVVFGADRGTGATDVFVESGLDVADRNGSATSPLAAAIVARARDT
jgi:hypothetical protein